MTLLSKLSTLVSAGVLATTLSACGGSSSTGLSRSQIDARADTICASATAAGRAVPLPPSFQDATVAAAYFDKIEPITAKATLELEALKPDSSVRSDWSAYIAARKQGLKLVQSIRRKAHAKDPSGLQDLKQASATQRQLIAAATKVGATSCAR